MKPAHDEQVPVKILKEDKILLDQLVLEYPDIKKIHFVSRSVREEVERERNRRHIQEEMRKSSIPV